MGKFFKRKIVKAFFLGVIVIVAFWIFVSVDWIKNSPKTNIEKTGNDVCSRDKPYAMSPEFTRAYSLLAQRFAQNPENKIANDYLEIYTKIYNCVDIKYANADTELNGAEGVFYFTPNSTKDRLSILVSPKYQRYDDLLTSLLLSHELTHAWNFVNETYKNEEPVKRCYDDETSAFTAQFIYFFSMLNEEEKRSIVTRAISGLSPVTTDFLNTIKTAFNNKTNAYEIGDFVYNHPFYQKQCGSRR